MITVGFYIDLKLKLTISYIIKSSPKTKNLYTFSMKILTKGVN